MEPNRVLGVERNTGDLYTVDLDQGTSTLLVDITDIAPGSPNNPNGLALDDTNTDRIYFSSSPTDPAVSTDLFWVENDVVTLAGAVPGLVGGATFVNGDYFYLKNETDDLVQVTLDANGLVSGTVDFCPDVTGNSKVFRLGDLAFDGGNLVYGSSLTISPSSPEFFSIDLRDCEFTTISGTEGIGLQLATTFDGSLYGQVAETGEFFQIDPATGSTASLGVPVGAGFGFTDLASAPLSCQQQ